MIEIHTPWLFDHRVYEVLTIQRYIVEGDPGLPDVNCALTWRMLPQEIAWANEDRERARRETLRRAGGG